MYPRLIIDLKKLKNNMDKLNELCHANGITTAFVSKVFCADEKVVKVLDRGDCEYIADSRIPNLVRCKRITDKPLILLRVSSPSEAESVIASSDISLQSEIFTIKKLDDAADKLGKRHKVVLMIDLGDLREGIFYENEAEIIRAAETVLNSRNLDLYGIGTNLTCYGGILPDTRNLGVLCDIADTLRKKYSIELPMVSGGNSSTIEFLKTGCVPKGITNLRLGESFVLGKDTAICEVVDGLYGDAITLEAEIVELKTKPSMPIGTSGCNAFGEKVEYVDKGIMRRAILAIGRQDTVESGLYCVNKKINVIGASSDHLLVDVTQNDVYNIGDTLRFTMDYGAVLRGFTSEYVGREYV